MLRTIVRLTPSFTLPFLKTTIQNETNLSVNANAPYTKTGWDRVRDMYINNEFGERSLELHFVAQSTLIATVVGAIAGGYLESNHHLSYFIDNNQATIFQTPGEAQKMLQNHVTVGFGKGAYYWGWRLGLFYGLFSLITTTMAVYRNDTAFIDYVIAGGVAGFLYKINLGPAAMVVGGVLGALLGTIGGLLIIGLFQVTGIKIEDVRKSFYKIHESRKNQMHQVEEKSAVEKHDDLTRYHDFVVQEKGVIKLEELE